METMDVDHIRQLEELYQQINFLGKLKEMAAMYGYDISQPAQNATAAVDVYKRQEQDENNQNAGGPDLKEPRKKNKKGAPKWVKACLLYTSLQPDPRRRLAHPECIALHPCS